MAKFRKKPIEVEAIQYSRRFDWPDWFFDAVSANRVIVHGTGKFTSQSDQCFCEVHTLDGVMRGEEGDWIVRGAVGEIYPCKPEAFAASFEPMEI